MAKYEFLVLSSFIGDEDDFNRWYDDVHVPDVLDIPGIVSARRFRVTTTRSRNASLPEWTYAALYTIDSDDPAAVLEEIRLRAGTPRMPISETLDLSQVATFLLEPRADGQHFHSRKQDA